MQTLIRNYVSASLLAVSISMTAPAFAQEVPRVRYQEIPEGAYSVVAQVRAKPGKEEMLREGTLPLIAKVRSDPKNLVYFLQEDRAKPGHFIFYEVFASQADFDAHNAMPYERNGSPSFRSLPTAASRSCAWRSLVCPINSHNARSTTRSVRMPACASALVSWRPRGCSPRLCGEMFAAPVLRKKRYSKFAYRMLISGDLFDRLRMMHACCH